MIRSTRIVSLLLNRAALCVSGVQKASHRQAHTLIKIGKIWGISYDSNRRHQANIQNKHSQMQQERKKYKHLTSNHIDNR
ncbi:hypothetical protein RND71_003076 [Anisodus tanguticus]|uniref:Secreted protein n=1 Tax=Anisodus tanguticus TaxID=243964 RepID=A0AAE1VWX1_9SOLA|nr:hypothetical protein RND71_003076 [Anisodus tanguticus]